MSIQTQLLIINTRLKIYNLSTGIRHSAVLKAWQYLKACGYINMQEITLPSLLRKLDSLQSKALNKMYDKDDKIDLEETSHIWSNRNNAQVNSNKIIMRGALQ